MTEQNKPTMRMTETAYQEWAGETIAQLTATNAELLEACKVGLDAVTWMADATDADPEDHERLILVTEAIRKAEEQA